MGLMKLISILEIDMQRIFLSYQRNIRILILLYLADLMNALAHGVVFMY